MVGVIGSGQVAQHVIAELRRRNLRYRVYTRSPQPDADASIFVWYDIASLPRERRGRLGSPRPARRVDDGGHLAAAADARGRRRGLGHRRG